MGTPNITSLTREQHLQRERKKERTMMMATTTTTTTTAKVSSSSNNNGFASSSSSVVSMMGKTLTTKASSNVGVREKHRRRHYLSRLQKSRHQCRRDKVAVATRAKNGDDEDVEEATTTGRNTRWLRRAFKTYRKISQDGVQIPTADDLSSGVQKSLNKRNVSLPEVPDVEDVKELMTRDPRELIPEIEVPELEDVVEDAKPFL